MQHDTPRHLAPAGGTFSRTRRRLLVYGLPLCLLCLCQTTLLAAISPLGITPDLCLLFVLGVAMFDGPVSGGAVGIAAGFLESAWGDVGVSFLPLLFFVVGYGIGHLSGRALARTFPSYLIFAAVLCLLRPALTLAAIGLTTGTTGFDLTAILRGTAIPEGLVNLIASLPMYPLIRKLDKWVQKKT